MLKILLIEDDEDDVLILQELLAGHNREFELTHCNDSAEALETLREEIFDVCLVDYYLGSETGFEVVKRILKVGFKGAVIMLTGAPNSEGIDEEALALGIDDYLNKSELMPSLLRRAIVYNNERKKLEHKRFARETKYRQLAEVSSSSLHNIGNVLNTLKVSSQAIDNILDQIESNNLDKLANLLEDGKLLIDDPKAKKVPGYLRGLRDALMDDTATIREAFHKSQERLKIAVEAISIQQKSMRSSREPTAISLIIGEAIALHRGILLREHIECSVVCPNLLTSFDHASLLHIMINLIKNGIEAMQGVSVKKLRVDVFREKGDICIRVTDSGQGIPGDVLSNLFAHGYTTKASGNGFGLHFCRQVLKNAGGDIFARSDGKGKGAYFQLTIPKHFEIIDEPGLAN